MYAWKSYVRTCMLKKGLFIIIIGINIDTYTKFMHQDTLQYMHNYTKNFTLLSNNTHKLYSHLLYIQFALKTKQNYLQP